MSYTHRELLDALSAMTPKEFEATVNEARQHHDDSRALVRHIFGNNDSED